MNTEAHGKTMTYSPRKPSIASACLRLLGWALDRWPLVLVAIFIAAPFGPHLFLGGEYRKVFGNRVYIACDYVGPRGVVTLDFRHFNDDCPMVLWLNSKGAGQ